MVHLEYFCVCGKINLASTGKQSVENFALYNILYMFSRVSQHVVICDVISQLQFTDV